MKEYFDLDIKQLQIAASWALKYVEEAIIVFERNNIEDKRPRNAHLGMMEFVETGIRNNQLRKLAMEAYKAARDEKRLIPSYAANAASLGAAIAYTHPFRDPKQAEHILGPVVYSILATDTENIGIDYFRMKIDEACSEVNKELIILINNYPAQEDSDNLKKHLIYMLDSQIRNIKIN